MHGFGILLLIVGVVLMIRAPRQPIEVMNSGRGVIRFPVAVFERARTVEFAHRVSEAVARKPEQSVSVAATSRHAASDPSGP